MHVFRVTDHFVVDVVRICPGVLRIFILKCLYKLALELFRKLLNVKVRALSKLVHPC